MEDHNNEKRPRQQGRSNYTRRAPRANNNNQNRKPGAPAPAASAPQAAAEKPQLNLNQLDSYESLDLESLHEY